MVKFLNDFMVNRHLDELSRNKLRQMFVSTVDTILKCLGEDAFKPKRALVAAVLDSIMVGIARRLERGQINDCSSLMKRCNELKNNELYIKSTTEHTTDEKTVQARIKIATEAFADVE